MKGFTQMTKQDLYGPGIQQLEQEGFMAREIQIIIAKQLVSDNWFLRLFDNWRFHLEEAGQIMLPAGKNKD
jgi:hypothetical protein